MKVDIIVDTATRGSDCGAQSSDSESGEGVPRPAAAPATLGGIPGWQIINVFDPSTSGGLTRIHVISVIHQGYCFNFVAYFVQENPDEATFLQIASSFKFSK